MASPEEIKAEYTSSLTDLTFNSKPLINVLTMLAEENLPSAKIIVEAIEEHLAKVGTEVKLPILYLIDCIVKNVGQTYTAIFSQNIVSTFCNVFKMVDEKTRLEMFKLRQTWNDVFPLMKLYAIDVQIHQIDPAWPVTALPSNSIHLNPKFLKNTPTTSKAKMPTGTTDTVSAALPTVTPVVPTLVAADIDKETLQMQEQLIKKQKELLELQKKTLELEVLQTQVKLQEQMKAGGVPPISTNILLKPEVAKQLIPEGMVKTRPAGIATAMNQRMSQQPRINPVNPALAAAVRPIRDPRLLRQQRQQQQPKPASTAIVVTPGSSVATTASQKITENNNKNVTSKAPEIGPVVLAVDQPKIAARTSDDGSSLHSSSSGSLTGSSTDTLGKSSSRRNRRDKRREKDSKRSQDGFDEVGVGGKRERLTKKADFVENSRKKEGGVDAFKGNDSGFKSVKNKNRNYMRRNLNDSPVVVQDEDFREAQQQQQQQEKDGSRENSPRMKNSPDRTSNNTSSMDIDLRQLPPATSKKRASTESSDQPSKKSKSFDVLFGNEDTDLRQLPQTANRPPTPPPPIISSDKKSPISEPVAEKGQSPSKRNDFDAIRAKLANATNRDKVLSKSFHKNKLQPTTDQDLRPKHQPKITISPEEEKVINSGHMTNEQGKHLLSKIFMQIEKDKLREAKQKDVDISLQSISDDELDVSVAESKESPSARQIPPPPMPFNDKDERLNIHPIIIPQSEDNGGQFYPRRGQFRPARDNWRGRMRSQVPQPPRPSVRPWLHQQQPRWRGPFPQPQRPPVDFVVIDDDSSRSPGPENQELTLQQDENKTISIDGIPRDIRIYDDTAVIFLNYDDPREISFQSGVRRVIFNNKESYALSFGDDYKDCLVNGYNFKVKLGMPSREIFINEMGFECFFGGLPIHVVVNGINLKVALEGPLPQVKISEEKRTDLVVGKINLFLNAQLMIPVFLDGKVQKIVVENESCTLKFVDALKRVLINDVPFEVEFGGLPKPFVINGKRHYIRFSVLPKGVKPGYVRIKDMEGEVGLSPPREENAEEVHEVEPLRPEVQKVRVGSPDNRSSSPTSQPILKNFEALSNSLSQTLASVPTTGGYQVQLPTLPLTTIQGATQNLPVIPPLNINDLFQKLVASGFVKTQENSNSGVSVVGSESSTVKPTGSQSLSTTVAKKPVSEPPQDPNAGKRRPLQEILKPVTFSRPETLKMRQGLLYVTLYNGMQCSSCGMRFPPEASMWYSQHLDWHFRQNRRGKKNARVANSRKWYFSLADWKNYEELEDLEEREKNYFDQQQLQAEIAEEAEEEAEIPTVPADPGSTNESCHVCRESFEQFFNEEKEEWHLRNAIRMDEKTYHPVCYEDYQKSILEGTLNESKTEEPAQKELIPGLEIILDDDDDDEEPLGTPEDIVSLVDDDEEVNVPEDAPSPSKDEDVPEEEGEDDDVILNEEAPIKIVVDDDDDELVDLENSNPSVTSVKKEKVPQFDDGFMDVGEVVTLAGVGQVKIKSEPVDDEQKSLNTSTTSEPETPGIHDTLQKTPEAEITLDLTPPDQQPSHTELITSIDGNIELLATPSNIPTTISSGNKIKINISKPLPAIVVPKETTEVVPEEVLPMPEPEITGYKPALENVPLRKLPPVQKGEEQTGMCSIM
ncbi:pre-mRNA cleavage complex 2 protein Pcf11 isoform X2 [Anthonomus grandis grandis]|uniref:pre-mRNA cleavage complex 2 protein Pcf11 isoform X2 n=1 Tax=Anthonomus grandis grandis TaxID=2921223 RepID=UPI00216594EB|nr:pre-mRNA cleavage complex 2 protein Pcf11 isoform X2 [Anthonomus grandis grandis]